MKVLVVGASEKTQRYSNKAVRLLKSKGHEVVALGKQEGDIEAIHIDVDQPLHANIDTVTMYVGAQNQPEYADYIKSLKPRRVIFNPGAENPNFEKELNKSGIETEEACTLVLLNLGAF